MRAESATGSEGAMWSFISVASQSAFPYGFTHSNSIYIGPQRVHGPLGFYLRTERHHQFNLRGRHMLHERDLWHVSSAVRIITYIPLNEEYETWFKCKLRG